MQARIVYLIANLIEGYIFWNYCNNKFEEKTSIPKQLLIIFLCSLGSFFLSGYNNVFFNLTYGFIAYYICTMLLYKIKWHSAIFHNIILLTFMCLCELIVIGIDSTLIATIYTNENYSMSFFILVPLSKLLYFLVVQGLLRFSKQSKVSTTTITYDTFLLNFIPFISLFIFVTLGIVSLFITENFLLNNLTAICAILLLIMNLFIFWLYGHIQKRNLEHTELQLQLQKESDMTDYYKQLIQHDEGQKILIHDIKHHLRSMSTLNEQGETTQLAAYIDDILQSKDLQYSVRICDNDMLNAILCRYQKICSAKGINFQPDVRSGLLGNFAYEEMTALFTNLMDNAVEATSQVENASIDLSITYREKTASTLISLINSCPSDPFDSKTGKLITHKKDSVHHGFGIRSIERVIKAHHGEMTMYYDKNNLEFHTIISVK